MSQRFNYMQQSAPAFKKLVELSMGLKESGLETGLQYLVEIRASQLNGCAFCLDMHVKQAVMGGERALRLHHVAIWHESPLFSARERAALRWTEVLTRMPEGGIADAVYAEVREQFSEKELSDLTWLVASINAWNRLNVAVGSVPGTQDKAFGLDKAGLV